MSSEKYKTPFARDWQGTACFAVCRRACANRYDVNKQFRETAKEVKMEVNKVTVNGKTFWREVVELPPSDVLFVDGLLRTLTAMYFRLHPDPAEEIAECAGEEEVQNDDNR